MADPAVCIAGRLGLSSVPRCRLVEGGEVVGGVVFALVIFLATLACIWALVWASKY